jgi:hypothetical protein
MMPFFVAFGNCVSRCITHGINIFSSETNTECFYIAIITNDAYTSIVNVFYRICHGFVTKLLIIELVDQFFLDALYTIKFLKFRTFFLINLLLNFIMNAVFGTVASASSQDVLLALWIFNWWFIFKSVFWIIIDVIPELVRWIRILTLSLYSKSEWILNLWINWQLIYNVLGILS